MPTVGQIVDKMSKLRSRAAIIDALMNHIQSNYVDNDSGTAEMKFVRSDHGVVPQDHILEFLEELLILNEEGTAHAEQWEALQIVSEEKPKKQLIPLKKKKGRRDEPDEPGNGGSEDHATPQDG